MVPDASGGRTDFFGSLFHRDALNGTAGRSQSSHAHLAVPDETRSL